MIKLASLLAALLLLHTVAAQSSWKNSLIFYAPFDRSIDATFAKGDKTLYHAPKIEFPAQGHPGLPPSRSISLEPGAGKFGDALRFHKKVSEFVYFKAKDNFPYAEKNMQGTVSFWLRLSPDEELEPGFTDPIQITSRSWDNAAFFVEFSKDEKPREFRLGIYPNHNIWNPEKKDWGAIPMKDKPLLPVVRPPFSKDKWTHVAWTFRNFNTGQKNGDAVLYLNGQKQGLLGPREQTFSWDLDKAMIMLGLSYIGFWDELAIFDRPLTESEIAELSSLTQPLK